MTPCNMMGYPMLEIFGSASPEVITTFYIPGKAPQHLYIMRIFVFKLFFQFLNSWWVFTNEAVRFEEEIALAVICMSLDGILGSCHSFQPQVRVSLAGCISHLVHIGSKVSSKCCTCTLKSVKGMHYDSASV